LSLEHLLTNLNIAYGLTKPLVTKRVSNFVRMLKISNGYDNVPIAGMDNEGTYQKGYLQN
jgi:hypothetical protein